MVTDTDRSRSEAFEQIPDGISHSVTDAENTALYGAEFADSYAAEELRLRHERTEAAIRKARELH